MNETVLLISAAFTLLVIVAVLTYRYCMAEVRMKEKAVEALRDKVTLQLSTQDLKGIFK